MATELVYLQDFDVTDCEAVVEQVEAAEDGRSVVILNQTCFYPRGGGQDWDAGSITGGTTFTVEEVRLDEHGVVHHIGRFKDGTFKPGDMVRCEVDRSRRDQNTRLHSAGHLIDMAVAQLDLPWTAVRGAHYPHMSFVEYGAPDAEADEQLKERLQAKADELGTRTYQNKILFIPRAEMAQYCRHVPDNIPANKPSRIVLYADDFGIPCGGTHVRQLADIGDITITKIKAKKGILKVSYAVAGIN